MASGKTGETWNEEQTASPTHTFFLKKEKQQESWRELHFIKENLKNKQTKQAVDKEGEMGKRCLISRPSPLQFNSVVDHWKEQN